jgi:hypothetical protein|nr:polysaccharide deacetylase family protein [Candidatus Krumholzibacteria bacterium]
VVDSLRHGGSLPDSVVVLTFDDGYRSVYTEAFPRLKERGWPFTVFVSSDAIDQREGPVATWEELIEMAAHGATIASHSQKHNHMPRLMSGETRQEWKTRLLAELRHSQQRILAETGQKHDLVAFPYGEFDAEVLGLLDQLGWIGFGQQSGAVGHFSDLRCLPRFPMAAQFAEMESFALKGGSLPLPVVSVQAEDLELLFNPSSVMVGAEPPLLKLKLGPGHFRPAELAAYAGGQGRIRSTWSGEPDRTLEVQAPAALTPGRSRYNVTVPDLTGRRWYWYSHTWVVGHEHAD